MKLCTIIIIYLDIAKKRSPRTLSTGTSDNEKKSNGQTVLYIPIGWITLHTFLIFFIKVFKYSEATVL